MKHDIDSREDLFLLVNTFYEKVRANETLGPFFNETIKDWDTHLQHITSFWETSLFITRKLEHKYHGNPLEVHIKVDKLYHHSITEMHFGIWLNLWFETLDALFEGDVTENAKRRARKMGTFIYLKLFEARQSDG